MSRVLLALAVLLTTSLVAQAQGPLRSLLFGRPAQGGCPDGNCPTVVAPAAAPKSMPAAKAESKAVKYADVLARVTKGETLTVGFGTDAALRCDDAPKAIPAGVWKCFLAGTIPTMEKVAPKTMVVPPGYHGHREADGTYRVHGDWNVGSDRAHAGLRLPWPKDAFPGQVVPVR